MMLLLLVVVMVVVSVVLVGVGGFLRQAFPSFFVVWYGSRHAAWFTVLFVADNVPPSLLL